MCNNETRFNPAGTDGHEQSQDRPRFYSVQGRVCQVLDVCLGPCTVDGCSQVARYVSLDDGRVVRECPEHDPSAVDRQLVISRTARIHDLLIDRHRPTRPRPSTVGEPNATSRTAPYGSIDSA